MAFGRVACECNLVVIVAQDDPLNPLPDKHSELAQDGMHKSRSGSGRCWSEAMALTNDRAVFKCYLCRTEYKWYKLMLSDNPHIARTPCAGEKRRAERSPQLQIRSEGEGDPSR